MDIRRKQALLVALSMNVYQVGLYSFQQSRVPHLIVDEYSSSSIRDQFPPDQNLLLAHIYSQFGQRFQQRQISLDIEHSLDQCAVFARADEIRGGSLSQQKSQSVDDG